MSGSVAGGVKGGEAGHRYRAVRGQSFVHGNRLRRRHDGRYDAHEGAPRMVCYAGDHRCVHRMSHDPSAGTAPQLGRTADVVRMPMRQEDRVHLADPSPCILDGTCDLVGPPRETGVDQHDAVVVDYGVGVYVSDGDLDDPIDHLAHVVILSRWQMRTVSARRSSQTGDRTASSWRTSGATSLPKSSIARMISA